MPVSPKQQKSVNKYISAHYDRINVTFAKGTRAKITAALKDDESVNRFIINAVNEALARREREQQ